MKRLVLLTCLASLHATDTIDWRQQGLAALGRGDWQAAAAAFDRVVATMPADADAWVLLGIARWHQGRAADALQALDRALPGHPSLEARARYYRALALTDLARDGEAADEFARIVEAFPSSEEAARIRTATTPAPVPPASRPQPTATDQTWHLDAGTALVWDSNPDRLDPDQVEDPRSDWMVDTYATLRWTGWSRRVGAMVAGRSEDYARRDDLDAIAAQGRLWFGVVADETDDVRIGGSTTRSWLGHQPFRWRHAAELGWWHGLDANRSAWCEASVASVRHDQEEDAGLDGPEYRADLGLLWEAADGGMLRSLEGRIGGGYGSAEQRDLASTQFDGLVAADWRPAQAWSVRWSGEGGIRLFGQESGSVTSLAGGGGGLRIRLRPSP